MRIGDYVGLALRKLRLRLFESIVIVIAIGLGTGVICIAVALTLGVINAASQGQSSALYDAVRVEQSQYTWGMNTGLRLLGDHVPKPAEYTVGLMYEIKEYCPDVKYVFSDVGTSIEMSMSKEFEGKSLIDMNPVEQEAYFKALRENRLQVTSTLPDYFLANESRLANGTFFTDEDVRQGTRVIVIGTGVAERLFPGEDAIGKLIPDMRGEPYTVIGVLERVHGEGLYAHSAEQANDRGYIPVTAGYRWADIPLMDTTVMTFVAIAKDSGKLRSTEAEINSFLKARFGEGYRVSSRLSQFDELGPTIRKIQLIGGFAASLGLLIAAINILNLMLAKVLKRTKEIGVLMAVGASRTSVLYLFLSECLFLGLFGALLGYGVSVLSAGVIPTIISLGFSLSVDVRVFLIAIGVAGFVSLLFGTYPAILASQVNPVDALRTE